MINILAEKDQHFNFNDPTYFFYAYFKWVSEGKNENNWYKNVFSIENLIIFAIK